MIINAEFIIKGLFGSKWAGAITSFQLLGIAGVLRVTLQYSGALAHATGKVYTEAMQQLIYFLLLAGFALFAIKYGIEGVAVSIIIASLWLFIAQSWLSLKILKSKWSEFFRIMIPGFANMIVMSIANIFLYYVCSNFFRGFKFEFLLLFVVISNCVVLLSCIFFIPSAIKADTFEWLIEKYKRFIPSFILKLYLKFN
jgi:O-antigen/teichoic acid export membrane protein